MPAYLIATITVHDRVEYDKYLAGFGQTFATYFAPYKGRVLVATEDIEVMEGKWPNLRTIVIEFPTMEDAKRWYKSPEYQTLAQHRGRFRGATTARASRTLVEPRTAKPLVFRAFVILSRSARCSLRLVASIWQDSRSSAPASRLMPLCHRGVVQVDI